MTQQELQDLDRYLEEMGVKDDSLRHRLQGALPWVDEEDLTKVAATSHLPVVVRINNPPHSVSGLHPLFVVCDASGGLGRMRRAFSQMERPCYGLLLPGMTPEMGIASGADLAELYMIAIRAQQRDGPYILGGVGMGCIVAYEVAVQLQKKRDQVDVLLMFEDPCLREVWSIVQQPWFKLYKLVERERPDKDMADYLSQCQMLCRDGVECQLDYVRSLVPDSTPASEWNETIQEVLQHSGLGGYGWEETLETWAALYQLTGADQARSLSIAEFVLKLNSLDNINSQLEYLSSNFRPPGDEEDSWDEKLNNVISKVSFLKYLTSRYKPGAIFKGECIFAHAGPACTVKDVIAGWAARSLKPIALFIQPVAMCCIETERLVSPQAVASRIEFSINSASRRLASTRQARSECLSSSQTGWISGTQPSPSLNPETRSVFAVALNSHCSESHYSALERHSILSHSRVGHGDGGPLASLPAWILHDEKGDAGGFIRSMARALPLPCYGLCMGTDASSCSSIDDLANSYADLIVSMQHEGPHLVVGCSIVGCMLAFSVGCHIERKGKQAMLILVDGSCILPSIPLHEPMWYALFYALREMGTLKVGIGDFVELMNTTASPVDQLGVVRTFKPAGAITDDKWDAIIYTLLDRAAVLKTLMDKYDPAYAFRGPVAAVMPSDRLGAAFLEANREACKGPISYMPIECKHTEYMISKRNRQMACSVIQDAVLEVLEMV